MNYKLTLPDIYKDFKCVAGDCTDTCCAGWQVDVDADSWEYYKNVKGKFGKRLKKVMEEFKDGDDSDGDRGCFTLKPSGWCPFLNDSLLCDLYTELGEEHLCRTCTNYPRFMEDYGPNREMGLALSCPEVSRLVLASDKVMKYVTELSEPLGSGLSGSLSSVPDPNGSLSLASDFREDYYELLVELRETAFTIVTNREIDVDKRAILYFDYCNALQEAIDYRDVDVIRAKADEIVVRYKDTKALNERYAELVRHIEELDSDADAFNLYDESMAKDEVRFLLVPEYAYVIYGELSHCKKEWVDLLNAAEEKLHKSMDSSKYNDICRSFNEYMKDREYEYEHALNYHVFRYFLKSYFDDDCYGKGQAALMQHIMLKELGVLKFYEQGSFSVSDQEYIFHLYSRELEHSEENYDAFVESLRVENVCNYEHLLALMV